MKIATIYSIILSKEGAIISENKLLDLSFEFAEIGDIVVVIAGDFKEEMPLVDELIAEEGKLQLFYDSNEHSLSICSYNQNFFETYNVSPDAKVEINKK